MAPPSGKCKKKCAKMKKPWVKKCKKKKCAACAECASVFERDSEDDDVDLELDDDDDDGPPDDVPLDCTKAQLAVALKQMGKTCSERVTAAVDDQTPLSNKERCFCYLAVDAVTASSMTCKTMAAKYNTMAQEYALCSIGATEFADNNPGRCDLNDLLPVVGKMGDECKSEVNRAIWNDTPLTAERRCQCYGQLDTASAQSMDCRIMASKTKTMAEEYAECMSS